MGVRASTLNTCRDTQEKKDVVKHELWSGDFPVSSDGDITARQRVFKVCFNEPDPADNLRILEMGVLILLLVVPVLTATLQN